jgi:hypothetical protein
MEVISPNSRYNASPHLNWLRFARLVQLEPLAAFSRFVAGTIVVGRSSCASEVVCPECAIGERRLCLSLVGMVGTSAQANPNNSRPALLPITCFVPICSYEPPCASSSGAEHCRARAPPTAIRIIEVYHLTAFRWLLTGHRHAERSRFS